MPSPHIPRLRQELPGGHLPPRDVADRRLQHPSSGWLGGATQQALIRVPTPWGPRFASKTAGCCGGLFEKHPKKIRKDLKHEKDDFGYVLGWKVSSSSLLFYISDTKSSEKTNHFSQKLGPIVPLSLFLSEKNGLFRPQQKKKTFFRPELPRAEQHLPVAGSRFLACHLWA